MKISCTAAALVAFGVLLSSPTAVFARQGAPGDAVQVAPAQVFGDALGRIEEEIVGAAEAMPANKYDFAPTNGNFQGVRTFGQQVKHIAQANFHYFSSFGVTPARDPAAIDKLTAKADIVKALKDSFAFDRQAIDTMTAQNAFAQMDAHHSTRAGLAAMGMAHANDHYGQMVEYLRMNGIIPPASRR